MSFSEGKHSIFPIHSIEESSEPDLATSHLGVDFEIELRDLLSATPGIKVLSQLVAINPFHLALSSRIDYLTALERQNGWLNALMQQAIVAVAGATSRENTGETAFSGPDDAEREDVSTALRLAPTTAQSRIDVARTIVSHLPNVCSALATGEISPSHATVIAKETAIAIRNGFKDEAIAKIEERALSFSEFHTPGEVGNRLRKAIAQISPEIFEDSVDRARDARKVSCYLESEGMSTVVALLPAEGAQIVLNALDSYIDRERSIIAGVNFPEQLTESERRQTTSADSRTMDMRRADALIAICTDALSDKEKNRTPHRRPFTVNVTVDLPTLLGLKENPGELAGYGPIPASVAREIASNAKWRRFITDPHTGNLLDFGRETYEPPQALVDFLIARDRTCRFPGCRRAAHLSDIDHAQSWESGGNTSPENLGALCRRHHRLKTHSGWKIESFSDGSATWTSPHGKKFFTPPRPLAETG